MVVRVLEQIWVRKEKDVFGRVTCRGVTRVLKNCLNLGSCVGYFVLDETAYRGFFVIYM